MFPPQPTRGASFSYLSGRSTLFVLPRSPYPRVADRISFEQQRAQPPGALRMLETNRLCSHAGTVMRVTIGSLVSPLHLSHAKQAVERAEERYRFLFDVGGLKLTSSLISSPLGRSRGRRSSYMLFSRRTNSVSCTSWLPALVPFSFFFKGNFVVSKGNFVGPCHFHLPIFWFPHISPTGTPLPM